MNEMIPSEGGELRTTASTEVAASRAEAEVKAAMVMARKFPRDEAHALARIKRSCERKRLAEVALYSYPRGGQQITGPSIRLAEVLAQSWGNVECGVIELERQNGTSQVMAFARDLETGFRDVKVFSVSHVIDTKRGPKHLRDERDIYEHVANMGARRKRACILTVIPRDVQDEAVEQVHRTLRSGHDKPLADCIRDMAIAFENSYGVTREQLEARVGHRLESVSETELVTLRGIYTSLKDEASGVEQWFPRTDEQPSVEADASGPSKSDALAAELQAKVDQPATDDGGPTDADQGTWPPDKRTKRGKAVAIWLERIGKVAPADMDARFQLSDEIQQDDALEQGDKDELARIVREGAGAA